jgi:mono/diheme cytochrome c family protein
MKSIIAASIFIAVCLLAACNNSNESKPSVYTSAGNSDTSTYTHNAEPALANTERGREIFQQRCLACHGPEGDARKDNAANLKISRIDSLYMTQVIKDGRQGMPMFKDAVADSDIGHLAVYVKSLRR